MRLVEKQPIQIDYAVASASVSAVAIVVVWRSSKCPIATFLNATACAIHVVAGRPSLDREETARSPATLESACSLVVPKAWGMSPGDSNDLDYALDSWYTDKVAKTA